MRLQFTNSAGTVTPGHYDPNSPIGALFDTWDGADQIIISKGSPPPWTVTYTRTRPVGAVLAITYTGAGTTHGETTRRHESDWEENDRVIAAALRTIGPNVELVETLEGVGKISWQLEEPEDA